MKYQGFSFQPISYRHLNPRSLARARLAPGCEHQASPRAGSSLSEPAWDAGRPATAPGEPAGAFSWLPHSAPPDENSSRSNSRSAVWTTSIRLRNRINIEIHTASYRSTRGYTIVAALLDEIAIWETDETSAEPDVEVINAIKPVMLTVPGSMLLCASSPHARRGALWEAYRKHFGQDGDPRTRTAGLLWKERLATLAVDRPAKAPGRPLESEAKLEGIECGFARACATAL